VRIHHGGSGTLRAVSPSPAEMSERPQPGSLASIRAKASPVAPVALHAVTVTTSVTTSADTSTSAGTCTVSVELRAGDDQAVAVAEGLLARSIVPRLVAEATLRALSILDPAAASTAIHGLVLAPVGGQTVVTATVVQVDQHGEEVRAGAAVVGGSGEHEAVARAVLSAAGRRR